MDKSEEIKYSRCFNCGKYILKEDAYKGQYCSLACSAQYHRCKNCGAFFKTKDGFSEHHCSRECSESLQD